MYWRNNPRGLSGNAGTVETASWIELKFLSNRQHRCERARRQYSLPAFMLTVSRLSKSFGGRSLFEDASLQVNRGERIALIGPNGAGKTTLISILLELEEPDTGEVALQRGVKVGFLPQESAPVSDETVLQVATALPGDTASKDQDC